MDAWISRLDGWLRRHRPDEYALLLPGRADNDWTALEKALAISLPSEFKALYEWRNGLDNSAPEPCFAGYFRPLSYDEIVSTIPMMNRLRLREPPFSLDTWWNPKWIPFASNGFGDFFCIDPTGAFGGVSGQIVRFCHDGPDCTILHEHLTAWVATVVVALEQGFSYYDDTLEPGSPFRALLTTINDGYPIAVCLSR